MPPEPMPPPQDGRPADLQALRLALTAGRRRFHGLKLMDLDGVDLDLSDCDLRGSCFQEARFGRAHFRRATLEQCSFQQIGRAHV